MGKCISDLFTGRQGTSEKNLRERGNMGDVSVDGRIKIK